MPSNKDYWIQRAQQGVSKADRSTLPFKKAQKAAYRETQEAICNSIDNLYKEFLVNGELSTTKLYEFGRWKNMQADIQSKISHIGVFQNQEANAALSKLYKETLGSTVSEFGKEVKWGFAQQKQMEQALSQRWVGNKNFSERIWDNTQALSNRVQKSIMDAASLGQGSDNLKKQVINEFGVSYSDASRLIDTETMYFYNQSTIDGYKESGLVDQYEFLAEDDGCDDCTSLNGQQFDIDDEENIPPLHPNCRCTVIPVVQF
jgi:SPP1 gp7 family putative phage head morphogenesis protein